MPKLSRSKSGINYYVKSAHTSMLSGTLKVKFWWQPSLLSHAIAGLSSDTCT